jgi:single-strand DNA-binding protein
MSINKAILVGNLGSDPEVKNFDSGKRKASFPLATSEQYKDRTTGEKKSATEWHNIVLWGALAEIAGKYLKKGSKVYVEGKIKSRSYETNNGEKRYITEIVGDTITMLGEKPQAVQQQVVDDSWSI